MNAAAPMAEPAAPMVETVGLSKSFGGFWANTDVDLTVARGERRVVIGPNGAGKSTLFNLLAGALPATRGKVFLDGQDVTALSDFQRADQGMARTFQITNLLAGMTVLDNTRLAVAAHQPARRVFWAPLAGRSDVDGRTEELLRTWGLWELRDRLIDELAYGQQRLLEIVMGLAAEPKVLLLDEPTAGLAAADARMMTDITGALPRDLTLLIIEHDMEVAFGLADTITVLTDGHVLVTGTPAEIRDDARVRAAYLGEEDE